MAMEIIAAELAKVLSVFGIAWFSFWAAIPAGLALGLHPLAVILVTSLSYASGVLVCVLPAQSVRRWVMRRFGGRLAQSTRDDQFIMRLWQRYGVIGFGLIAPMTTGAQLGAIIGITLNIPRNRLVIAMMVGRVGMGRGVDDCRRDRNQPAWGCVTSHTGQLFVAYPAFPHRLIYRSCNTRRMSVPKRQLPLQYKGVTP